MAQSYNHKKIEKKWNKIWQEKYSSETDVSKTENKYYCLDMFPYPSGEGLHVGHWRGYVMSDFYTRHAKLQGKNVLHPMGFDSFGLPAENAAIKHKTHPEKFTEGSIKNFTKQLNQMGATFDWSKAITTSSPEYYKWTQWLFLQLYKHGYAKKRKSLVNWCPKDHTVLANEQVVNGCCERCGTTVTKKELEQWYLLTTKLADELLDGLDEVDWPERVKNLQRNWIGKSTGAEVVFKSEGNEIKVFTTRPDTLFGVNAIVLAPEHPLAKELAEKGGKLDEFNKYFKEVSSKTNIDRQQGKESEKTAVNLNATAVHPLTNEKIPIWVADYVLMDYGTGAVMSVPAHDERDFMFAKVHKLPIKRVIESKEELPYSGHGKMVESDEFNDKDSLEASSDIIKVLESKKLGKKFTTFKLRDWLVSRQRYWGAPIPIIYDPNGKPHAVKDEHLPIKLPNDVDFIPGGESPLKRSNEYVELAEKLYGKGWRFDTDTLDTFVDSSWYFLRYLTPNDDKNAFDKELVSKWLPVDLYIGGIEHATLHLLYARFIYKFLNKHNYISDNSAEPFKKLFNIGMITLHGAKMSKSKGNVVSPDPLIEHYGTDALRGYEMFVGPLDMDAEWSSRGINGVHRFLIKLNDISQKISKTAIPETAFNAFLKNADEMIKDYRLNTLVSEYMKFINSTEKTGINKEVFEKFLVTLSPLFPYISQELWEKLGNSGYIFEQNWPSQKKDRNKKQISVLVNQKFVTKIEDPGSESALNLIFKKNKDISAKIGTKKPKVVYIPGKVVNIIVN